MQRGIQLRLQGANWEALKEFEFAYALAPTPRGRAQIGLAYQALGDWLNAEIGLDDALSATDDPWIAQYREALWTALGTVRSHLGWLSVQANVDQSRLLIGSIVHDLPLRAPIRMVTGPVEFDVRATGYVSAHVSTLVTPLGVVVVTVSLQPEVPVARDPAAREQVGTRTDGHGRAAVIAFGAAGIFTGLGLAAWGVREHNLSIYDDDSRCRFGTLTRDERCGGYAITASFATGLEVGAFVVAGASVVVGTWLVWPGGSHNSRISVSCGFPFGSAVACSGAF